MASVLGLEGGRLRERERSAAATAERPCDQKARHKYHIIDRAVATPTRPSIIATEDGVFHEILRRAPGKELIQAPGMDESCECNRCPYMRLNTLQKLYLCLRDLSPQVTVPEPTRIRALAPIELMLELS